MTPYYEQDGIVIYHGDCREIAHWLKADVLMADPPYGFGKYDTDESLFGEWLAHCVLKFTSAAVFGYPELLVGWCVRFGLPPSEWVTWWPTNKFGNARGAMLPRGSEHIAIFGATHDTREIREPRTLEGQKRRVKEASKQSIDTARVGDVWRMPSPGMGFNAHIRQHPNEKPVALLERLVVMCSRPTQTILDPSCGSGTALVAAKQHGRRAIGIELEEKYCEIAAKRLAQGALDLFGEATA